MKRIFLTYNQVHNTIQDIAEQIKADGYDFDCMVAIGTGGYIPARMLRTFIKKPIIAVGIMYYSEDTTPDVLLSREPVITQWPDNPEKQIKDKRILVVDEVDDTRSTICLCIENLLKHGAKEVAAAVLHDKDKKKKREFPPEMKRFYRGALMQDEWICYPWDAQDINEQDTKAGKESL